MHTIIKTKNAPTPIGPYNQATLAGNTLFLSGQIALNPETNKLVMDSIPEETHQVMKNMVAVLKEAEMDISQVVKCSIFLSNMDNFPIVNEVYGSYFTDNYPARETVQVSKLPMGVNVEISAIAVK
jgi:2-iminobutanoate/2-iminopropanoate deaminase